MSGHISETGRLRFDRYRPTSGSWRLDLTRYRSLDEPTPSRRPVVMVPGYAMNAFILGYHPTKRSMVEFLVDRGFEVWTANLRGQGNSSADPDAEEFGFEELACSDLPRVRDVVLEETKTGRTAFDVVGCSLGASYLYAYLTLHPDSHDIGSVVAIGGPLRWVDVHPAVRLVFANPTVAGALPSTGTRLMARLVLPIVKRLPALASLYMNAHQIALEEADQLVRTIDDPHPRLNRQISRWIQNRDLVVAGTDITGAIGEVETPVLCVLANRDGIVQPSSALSIVDAIGTDDVDVLRVGDDARWFAHADLFISEHADRDVFAPIGDWLEQRE